MSQTDGVTSEQEREALIFQVSLQDNLRADPKHNILQHTVANVRSEALNSTL